jgi:hypothetical protein
VKAQGSKLKAQGSKLKAQGSKLKANPFKKMLGVRSSKEDD